MLGRLTALTVSKRTKPGHYGDGGGLWLQVSEAGTKSWVFRFTLAGKRREMGLGPTHTVGLGEAREKAQECRRMLLAGDDPIERRRDDRATQAASRAKVMTFDQAATAYIDAHRAGWKNSKHADQWANTLGTYAAPVLGGLSVAAVDTGLVLKVLEPIWTTKTETASRLRGRIEAVLDWARVRGYRQGENPARWRGHMDKLLPPRAKVRKVEHHAALPYREAAVFLRDLRDQPGLGARALEFAILTATRSNEVRGATWGEIDLDAGVWTIPVERMKAGKEHRIPLTADALALLESLPQRDGCEFVFFSPTGKRFSDAVFSALLRRMGRADLTAHGFRSTFRDWAGETTAYPREVIEHALAHQLKDKAEAAYQRGDLFAKRRRLMADWCAYLYRATSSGEAIPINRATA